jgi:hypothetical protein
MMRAICSCALIGLVLSLAACGRPFKVETAPGFVELENQTDYAYRSTTPEGVVFGIRVVEDEKRGDLGFWTRALTLQMHDVSGYALLGTEDVKALDGTPGKLLKFGHDEDNKPYSYWLAIYMAQDRLFLVEAGGTKEQTDRLRPQVEWMLKSVKVRCDTFVSPVLASRTCNKW